MTTPDQIQSAYSNTLQCQNGYKIEDCLHNGDPEKSRTVYGILHYLRQEKSNFGVSETLKYGPEKIFQALYKMGEFEVVVETFWPDSEYPFYTIEVFAKWLNDCERRILEATQCLNT